MTRWLLPLALGGVVLAALLWSLGLVMTLRGGPLTALLAAAGLLAGWSVLASALTGARTWLFGTVAGSGNGFSPTFSLALGLLALGGVGNFLTGLFVNGTSPALIHNQAEVLSPALFPAPPDPSASALDAPPRLRVLNLNVLHGYPDFDAQERRYGLTLEAFRALECHVLILQESWRTRHHGHLAERLAEDLGLNMSYARANGSLRFLGFEEGSAILSRYPIRRARKIVLEPRRPWWESRIALVATLDVTLPRPGATNEEELTVAGLHLTHRGVETAGRQARALASLLDPSSVLLVGGDFNAQSTSQAVRAFTEGGFVDLIPGGIDHLLMAADGLGRWRVLEARRALDPEEMERLTGQRVAISDHPALLVDLESGGRLDAGR